MSNPNFKRINQRKHAKQRAAERYGLELNRKDLADMSRDIKCGKASLIEQTSNRVGVYLLYKDGRMFKVVYDKKRDTIVTFLPHGNNVKEEHEQIV